MDYNYSNNLMYQTTPSPLAGLFGGLFMVFYLVFLIAILAGMWKTFTKAGKPGWAVLIPFYNIYVLLQIVGKPGWWLILYFIPFVNLVIMIIVMLDLAKAFGKSVLFAIFALIIFPIVGFLILGFGKATYSAPQVKG